MIRCYFAAFALLAFPLLAQNNAPSPAGNTQVAACQDLTGRAIPCPESSGTIVVPAPPAPPPDEPAQFFTVNAGIKGLGPAQVFGSYSMSQRIGDGLYTTEITEITRIKGGKVGTCARAGVSKILYRFSAFQVGIVGDAGVCQGDTGSASGAMAERMFLAAKLGKTPFWIVGTAEGLHVAGAGNQTVVTLGVGYGFGGK